MQNERCPKNGVSILSPFYFVCVSVHSLGSGYSYRQKMVLIKIWRSTPILFYMKMLRAYDFMIQGFSFFCTRFNPVVGGGPNSSVIHYARNDQKVSLLPVHAYVRFPCFYNLNRLSQQIKDGDLVLMDVGCELHGYVSDLTRTWPPCSRFSSVQVAFDVTVS